MRVERYSRGYRLVLEGRKSNRKPGFKGPISDFSDSSRRNLAWNYANGHWCGMLTLTYPRLEQVPSREQTKRDIHQFLKMLTKNGIHYLWILEFQRRGYPHYHVWVGRNLTDTTDPVTGDRLRRHFPWRRCMISWLRIIGQQHNPSARSVALHPMSYVPWEVRVGNNYAAKYADKRKQKGLPVSDDGTKIAYGRWWGKSTDSVLPKSVTRYDEGPNSVQCRRVLQRCLVRWFPSLRRAYMRPTQGIRRSLDEKKLVAFERIIQYYMGDPLTASPQTRPDTYSYAFRCAMSEHRYISQRGANNADQQSRSQRATVLPSFRMAHQWPSPSGSYFGGLDA